MTLTTLSHKLIPPANNHGIISAQLGPYANQTERRAEVLTAAQKGLVAEQLSDSSLWVVVYNGTGYSWGPLCAGPEVTFSGDFGALFTGVLTSVASHVGLVEGTTLLHSAGSGPVLTFSGTRTGSPTAITVTCPTTGGARGTWLGLVTYGDGSTQAFTSAATVALTGLGAGLTLNIATGTAVTTDVWKATAATWTDQSGAGKNFTEATASLQPVIAVGPNGKACVKFDGVDDTMSAAVGLAAPGTTPYTYLAAVRIDAWSSNTCIIGADSFVARVMMEGSSPQIKQGNSGGNLVTGGPAVGAFGRLIAEYTNSASDLIKFGSVPVNGTSAAENSSTFAITLATTGSLAAGAVSFLHFIALNNVPTAPQLSAYDAAIASFYGAGNVAA